MAPKNPPPPLPERPIIITRFHARAGHITVLEGQRGVLIQRVDNTTARVRMSITGIQGLVAWQCIKLETGWPYVAVNTWSPAPGAGDPRYRYVSIYAGDEGIIDEGEVVGWNEDGTLARVTFHERKQGRQHGWVRAEAIKIGTKQRYGDWVSVNKQLLTQVSVNFATNANPGKAWQAVKALCDALGQNSSHVALFDSTIAALIADETSRINSTNAIIMGMDRAGVLLIFNNPNSGIDEIATQANDASVKGKPNRSGVYARLYALIKGERDHGAVYTGSTQEFQTRDKQHSERLATPKCRATSHAQAFLHAQKKCVKALCELRPEEETLMLLAEQILLLLIGSYDPKVLPRPQDSTASKLAAGETFDADEASRRIAEEVSGVQPGGETFAAQVDIEEEGRELQGQEDVDEADKGAASKLRWKNMKTSAAQILAIATKALQHVHWTPMIKRPSPKFGSYQGLNIASPATLAYTGVVYTRHTIPGQMQVYRRSSRQCKPEGRSKFVGKIGGPSPAGIEILTAANEGPDYGSRAYMVYEVTLDGKPHPKAWARLPGVCLYDDDHRAMTLGIRMEWEEDGRWY
ncbi:hypothetical protein KC323_g9101 [Hortaea werneckii]|nr:hypothetical protein KC323_g9101 [Hortaea werneckii]